MDTLEQHIRALKEPLNYWKGVSAENLFHPENLVFFSRKHTSHFAGYSPIVHYRYNIIFNLKGSLQIHIDNRTVILDEGEFILIFPYQSHYYFSESPKEILWFYIGFDLPGRSELNCLKYRPMPVSPFIRNTLQHMLTVEADLQVLLLSTILTAGLNGADSARGTVDKGAPEETEPLISRTRDYLFSHMDQPVTAGRIAEKMGVSESSLYKCFQRAIGISPGRYIRDIKMNHACLLLESGDRSISEISRLCGYDTLFSFSRAFKNATGISPSRFRNQGFKDKTD